MEFIKALNSKLTNFKKLGLNFNEPFKKFNISTPKIKQNREVKLAKKADTFKTKVESFILSKKIPYEFDNNNRSYKFYVKPTAQSLNDASSHYLVVKKL